MFPPLYTFRMHVHVMNLAPASLCIDSGVRLIDCEVMDLPITEFELPVSAFSGTVSFTYTNSADLFAAA